MKKEYETPRATKMEFNYDENVTASSGYALRKFINKYEGCRETETDEWWTGYTGGPGCERLS